MQTFCYSGLGFYITTCIRGIENGLWTFGYKQYSHVSFALGPWHLTRFILDVGRVHEGFVYESNMPIESCIESNRAGLPITPLPDWFFGTFAAKI